MYNNGEDQVTKTNGMEIDQAEQIFEEPDTIKDDAEKEEAATDRIESGENQNAVEHSSDERDDGELQSADVDSADVCESESEEIVLPKIELPSPQYEFINNISAFCFSQVGESHVKKGSSCQDRCGMRIVNDTIVIAAIADGVGSCALSDYGADVAVNSSLEYMENYFMENMKDASFSYDDPSRMGKVLRQMMQHALSSVEKKATEMEQLAYSFQSTLTVAVYDGKTLYFAHAGDDGIVALNAEGTYAMVTARHKGDEASSVYPLQSQKTWQFGKVDNTVAFVMATDGVLDAFVRPSAEKNRVYYPFVEPVFYSAQNNIEDSKTTCDDWYEYMASESYRRTVTDDLTFVGIVNQMGILEAQKPVFDISEWTRKTEEYEKKRREALYPKDEKQKHRTDSKIGSKDAETGSESNHTQDVLKRPTGATYRKIDYSVRTEQRPNSSGRDFSGMGSQASEFIKKTSETLEEVAAVSAGILAEGMIYLGETLDMVSQEMETRRKNRKQDNASNNRIED